MGRCGAVILMLLLGVLAAGEVCAEGTTSDLVPGSDLTLKELLARMDEVHARLSTLSIDFVQVKTVALLKAPVTSEGHFYYTKPDRICWEYGGEDAMIMVLNGDTMTMYYPDLKQADILDISRFRNRVFRTLSLGQSSKVLKKQYRLSLVAGLSPDDEANRKRYLPKEYFSLGDDVPRFTRTLYILELIPKKRRIAKRMSKIHLWIEEGRWLPVMLRYEQRNGDTNAMVFRTIRVNEEIPESRYQIELPPDVEISHRIDRSEPEAHEEEGSGERKGEAAAAKGADGGEPAGR